MSKREQIKKINQQKILQAYIELLGKMDYQQISVADICSQAGVARKTLYSHFSSKEEILDTVSQQVMFTGSIKAFTDTLREVQDTEKRLEQTFSQLSTPLSTYQGEKIEVFVQLIQNMTARLSAYSGKFSEFHQAAHHYFTECKKSPDTKNDFDVDFVSDLTVNAAVGIILSWVSNPDYPATQRMEGLKQHIEKLILEG